MDPVALLVTHAGQAAAGGSVQALCGADAGRGARLRQPPSTLGTGSKGQLLFLRHGLLKVKG